MRVDTAAVVWRIETLNFPDISLDTCMLHGGNGSNDEIGPNLAVVALHIPIDGSALLRR